MNFVEVDIGGKLRGLKFNQLSLEVYLKSLDVKLGLDTSAIYATFYAGLMANCYVKREEPDFTFEHVTEWVDEIYDQGRKEEIEKVCSIWAETYAYKNWLTEFQDRVRAIMNPESEAEPKKKMKSISNGTPSISSPLVL